jgi:ribonucleoside-diphosphate reductase alpha chain
MYLDDSACNLASLNLMRFRRPDGEFDVDAFNARRGSDHHRDGDLVDNASTRPSRSRRTPRTSARSAWATRTRRASHVRGLPYDGDTGRAYSAAITSSCAGHAYTTSAKIAAKKKPLPGYERNREPFLTVMRKHQAARRHRQQARPGDLVSPPEASGPTP